MPHSSGHKKLQAYSKVPASDQAKSKAPSIGEHHDWFDPKRLLSFRC